MTVNEARTRAAEMHAAIKRGEDLSRWSSKATLETVAEAVFQHHRRIWKARTLYAIRCYLKN